MHRRGPRSSCLREDVVQTAVRSWARALGRPAPRVRVINSASSSSCCLSSKATTATLLALLFSLSISVSRLSSSANLFGVAAALLITTRCRCTVCCRLECRCSPRDCPSCGFPLDFSRSLDPWLPRDLCASTFDRRGVGLERARLRAWSHRRTRISSDRHLRSVLYSRSYDRTRNKTIAL